MFAYCNNNPVMFTDPTGEFPWWAIAVGVVVQSSYVVIGSMVVNHIVNAVMKSNIEDELQESYTKKEAEAEIGKIVGTSNISFNEYGAHITGSKNIKSRRDRLYVSTILSRTEGFDRSATNISAEWVGHNVVSWFWNDPKVNDADLNVKNWDNKPYIAIGTILLEILGWC